MHTKVLILAVALLGALSISPLAAPPAEAAAIAVALDDAADDAFAPLQRRFDRLYNALAAMGGIGEQERPIVEELRDRFAAFRREHPGHLAAISGELQLSMWLGDTDRADELFETLTEQQPDNRDFAKAWARFAEREYDEQGVDQLYRKLFDRYPDDIDLRITRAEQLKRRNQYHRALEVLNSVELDPTEHPRAVMLKADCLFAEQRFEEALEAIRTIPEFAVADDANLKRRVDDKELLFAEYVDLWAEEQALRAEEASADDLPRVQLNTERGVIVVELFENEAPNTVANFISLVEDDYYNGTRFHRVIPNFMAQGGDRNSKDDVEGIPGQGGPGWRIPDEHTLDNHRKHFTGSLAMAKTAAPDTAGSQFYLTHEPTAHLNGRHTVFGRVLDGLDVVRSIEQNDLLESAVVLRKRDHDYEVDKLTGDEVRTPAAPPRVDEGDERDLIFSPSRLNPDAADGPADDADLIFSPPKRNDADADEATEPEADQPLFSPRRQQQQGSE